MIYVIYEILILFLSFQEPVSQKFRQISNVSPHFLASQTALTHTCSTLIDSFVQCSAVNDENVLASRSYYSMPRSTSPKCHRHHRVFL